MTPWAELSTTGRLGDRGAVLLYDVAAAVARGYPPPSGGRHWRTREIQELAHTVMTMNEKVPFAERLLANAVDDATLRTYLHRLVRQHLANVGRKTTKGARIRRLRPLLRDPRFARVGRDHYTLAGGPAPDTGPFNPARLRDAAWGVDVERPNWGPDTARTPPEATDASTVQVCMAVLGACPHPLHVGDLADVLGERFGVPPDEPDASYDGTLISSEPVARDEFAEVDSGVDAERIWSELDDEERRTILVLDLSARDAASRLGVGRTKANALQRCTLAAIARAVSTSDVPEEVDALRSVLRAADVLPVVAALVSIATERFDSAAGDGAS